MSTKKKSNLSHLQKYLYIIHVCFVCVNFLILMLRKALLAPGAVPPLVQLLMVI